MEKAYYFGQVMDDVNDKVIEIVESIAEYDDIEKPFNRYSLEIILKNNGKNGTLTAILFNPSEKAIKKRSAFSDNPIDLTLNGKKKTFVDGTITNVIRIANHCGYSKIIVLNLFSVINPKPEEILKNPQNFISLENNSKIEAVLKNENDVLIAWGNDSNEKINELKQNWRIKTKGSLKCFSLNGKSNTPTHPSPYNYGKVRDFLSGKPELMTYSYGS